MTRAAWALLCIVPLAGCLDFEEPDIFPVCEDRRAEGPAPPFTTDQLLARSNFTAPADEATRRALAEAARALVVTMKSAPYRAWNATFSPAGEGAWRFEARGVGGPEEASVPVDDAYDVLLALGPDGRARPPPHASPHPLDAPDTVERLALRAVARNPEMPGLLAPTPRHVDTRLDPDLPACAFLTYAAQTGDATTLVVVNLVRANVVHYDRGATTA